MAGEALKLSAMGTVTVTCAGVASPPGPEAVMVKVVVSAIGTTSEPDVGSGPVSSPWGIGGVILTEVALVVFQVRVVV